MAHYTDLGEFSDWVQFANELSPLFPRAEPGPRTQRLVREALSFEGEEAPREVKLESSWKREGLEGEEVSWSVGYGPRTRAWVLKPEGSSTWGARLPAVVALHDHGGWKFHGKEKIADGAQGPLPLLEEFRAQAYGGRAWANELARQGFVVLIHDTFCWGSRRFPLQTMTEHDRLVARALLLESSIVEPEVEPSEEEAEAREFNLAAGQHEHLIEKYCHLLNTTMAGVVAFEDRVAASYLASREDVDAERIGCAGLSGGGCRSALLQATCERIKAAVIVGMMSTFEGLLDHNVATHTWMLLPSNWARWGDWSDLAACRAPSPLLVQFDKEDTLFTPQGMQDAHERLAAHYAGVGAPQAYQGEFYEGGHKFDAPMQQDAFAWLHKYLSG